MRALPAAMRGIGGTLRNPRLLFWLWLAQLLAALPAAILVGEAVERSLGASLEAGVLRDGFSPIWHSEYAERAEGMAATFGPQVIGAAAFFDNLESWLWGDLFLGDRAVVASGVGFALLWALLLGGALEQLARPEPRLSLATFLARGGEHFARFVRVAALTGLGYWGVYRLARWLFPLIERATRDVTVETTILAYNLAAVLGLLLLLGTLRMVSDYAKIALVSGRRRSAVLGLLAGLRFVAGRPLRTWGVVSLFALAGAGALAGYALVAPGIAQSSWVAVVVSLAASQLFLLLRLGLRIALLGAEVELYRGRGAREAPSPFRV